MQSRRSWRRARTRQMKRTKTAAFYSRLMVGRDPNQFQTLDEFLAHDLLALDQYRHMTYREQESE